MRRWFKIVLPAVACVCFCSGCRENRSTRVTTQTGQREITFSWWGNDSRHEYTIEAIREFEKLHPEIKVTLEYGDWSGYQDRMAIKMASDTEADVMQINYAWLKQYSPDGNGFLDLYRQRSYIRLVPFNDAEEKLGTIDGKLNALPISLNAAVFYWNQTLLQSYGLEIPKTWDDLFAAAEKMSPDGIYPLEMEPKFFWLICASYVEQQSGRKLFADGELGFGQKEIEEMVAFADRLIQEHVTPRIDDMERRQIALGGAAGSVTWISGSEPYTDLAAENGYELKVGDYLTMENAKRSGWYYKPAMLYAISATSRYPREAAMLLDFLLSSDTMAVKQKLEKGVPISNLAREALEKNNLLEGFTYDGFEKLETAMDKTEVMEPEMESDVFINAFKDAVDKVEFEKQTVQEAAQELYDLMETEISRG